MKALKQPHSKKKKKNQMRTLILRFALPEKEYKEKKTTREQNAFESLPLLEKKRKRK